MIMNFTNIIRIEKIRVIDDFKVLGFDYIPNPKGGILYPPHITSRGLVTKSHFITNLILFNKWKFLIKKIIK